MELPPRARRIRLVVGCAPKPYGTTSACAENTIWAFPCNIVGWNYLRVRGEYAHPMRPGPEHGELPPRARRIPWTDTTRWLTDGTTSACAENTSCARSTPPSYRNYLRVRGEYSAREKRKNLPRELPPRARRIPKISQIRRQTHGTTSACAENTACPNER